MFVIDVDVKLLQSTMQESQEACYYTDTADSGRWAQYVCGSVSIFLI